ncbi:transposase, partial [bacterium]|nr:transposase [bacterium]
MPRANRYIIPGGIWHLTHRCHERAHLLRFSRDRERWRHWLFEAVKRHDLTVLTFCITCNHIHLVVRDKEDGSIPRAIPRAMQLLQGRMAQEYNTRKDRTGAYWEDRYHATAVESGTHLLRCLCYVELNMVRAGAVAHPSEWM